MDSATLPPVSIPEADCRRLAGLVQQAAADRHPVTSFLLGELQRATVVPEQELPAGTVTLNGWVTYRSDLGWLPESRLLVCPEDYRCASFHLSVLSPLGAALIGLRVGSQIPYRSIEGILQVASVDSLDAPIALT
jgi:regulator of nucleoside diphosphate kinase